MLSKEEIEMLKDMFDTGKKPRGADFAFLIDWLSEAGMATPTRRKEIFVASQNQTVFQLSGFYTMNNNQIEVVIGGVPQYSPENFTETSPTKFTLNSPVAEGTEITVIYFE